MLSLSNWVGLIRNNHRSLVLVIGLLTTSLTGCSTVALPIVGGALVTGAVVTTVTDRRPIGSYVSDKAMAFAVAKKLDKNIPNSHINATIFNRTILLTGEVLDVASHAKADEIVRSHPEVRKVFNYLRIGPLSSWSLRANDVWVTSKVHLNLMSGKGYPHSQIKVVTERGTVYVMGLLNDAEIAAATRVISQTAGVQEVITLVESYVPWKAK